MENLDSNYQKMMSTYNKFRVNPQSPPSKKSISKASIDEQINAIQGEISKDKGKTPIPIRGAKPSKAADGGKKAAAMNIIRRNQEIKELNEHQNLVKKFDDLAHGKFFIKEEENRPGDVICYCNFGGEIKVKIIPKEQSLQIAIKAFINDEESYYEQVLEKRDAQIDDLIAAKEKLGCDCYRVSNKGEAEKKLKNAPIGSFAMWKSNSTPGVVNFYQKLPDGKFFLMQIPFNRDIREEVEKHILSNKTTEPAKEPLRRIKQTEVQEEQQVYGKQIGMDTGWWEVDPSADKFDLPGYQEMTELGFDYNVEEEAEQGLTLGRNDTKELTPEATFEKLKGQLGFQDKPLTIPNTQILIKPSVSTKNALTIYKGGESLIRLIAEKNGDVKMQISDQYDKFISFNELTIEKIVLLLLPPEIQTHVEKGDLTLLMNRDQYTKAREDQLFIQETTEGLFAISWVTKIGKKKTIHEEISLPGENLNEFINKFTKKESPKKPKKRVGFADKAEVGEYKQVTDEEGYKWFSQDKDQPPKVGRTPTKLHDGKAPKRKKIT